MPHIPGRFQESENSLPWRVKQDLQYQFGLIRQILLDLLQRGSSHNWKKFQRKDRLRKYESPGAGAPTMENWTRMRKGPWQPVITVEALASHAKKRNPKTGWSSRLLSLTSHFEPQTEALQVELSQTLDKPKLGLQNICTFMIVFFKVLGSFHWNFGSESYLRVSRNDPLWGLTAGLCPVLSGEHNYLMQAFDIEAMGSC